MEQEKMPPKKLYPSRDGRNLPYAEFIEAEANFHMQNNPEVGPARARWIATDSAAARYKTPRPIGPQPPLDEGKIKQEPFTFSSFDSSVPHSSQRRHSQRRPTTLGNYNNTATPTRKSPNSGVNFNRNHHRDPVAPAQPRGMSQEISGPIPHRIQNRDETYSHDVYTSNQVVQPQKENAASNPESSGDNFEFSFRREANGKIHMEMSSTPDLSDLAMMDFFVKKLATNANKSTGVPENVYLKRKQEDLYTEEPVHKRYRPNFEAESAKQSEAQGYENVTSRNQNTEQSFLTAVAEHGNLESNRIAPRSQIFGVESEGPRFHMDTLPDHHQNRGMTAHIREASIGVESIGELGQALPAENQGSGYARNVLMNRNFNMAVQRPSFTELTGVRDSYPNPRYNYRPGPASSFELFNENAEILTTAADPEETQEPTTITQTPASKKKHPKAKKQAKETSADEVVRKDDSEDEYLNPKNYATGMAFRNAVWAKLERRGFGGWSNFLTKVKKTERLATPRIEGHENEEENINGLRSLLPQLFEATWEKNWHTKEQKKVARRIAEDLLDIPAGV